jgi:ribonuclease inhibitor
MAGVARIDLSQVRTSKELHKLIERAMGFPDYYGRNWDAFDECASDPSVTIPAEVYITGIGDLTVHLPREAALMRRCFSDVAATGRLRIQWVE